MARYPRRGHYRRGRNGTIHWVSGHMVNRGSWSGSGRLGPFGAPAARRAPSDRVRMAPTRSKASWTVDPEHPNARCPICFEQVWFFRNKRGGCAYFDALGKPWPLHPCMEHPRTAEDRRAALEAPLVYEREERARSRSAVGKSFNEAHRDSAVRLDAAPSGKPYASASPESQRSTAEPLSWWVVLGGLLALLLSFPVSRWVDTRLDGIPALLSLWAISLPTLCMALAIGWYLLRAPRPRGDAGDVLASVALAPLLLLFGIVGNVLTCGLGALAAALWVASEANDARRRGNLGGGY